MLDSLSPPRRRLVLSVIAALAVGVLVLAGALVRSAGDDNASAPQDVLGPVLIVPGYGGDVASVAPLVETLETLGRDVTVVQPIDGGTGDLAAQADRLGDAADAAMERTGAASVDVIGYSAGGVVARLWVRDGGGASVARRVLTIGSPHHGTDLAALAADVGGGCPLACEQLAPGSDLLRRLNAGDETPNGPEWIAIRSSSDQVVTPTESAALDGALDLVVQEFCPLATTAHTALPGDPLVLAALASTLGPAAPRIPIDLSC